jgi:hypothetical protein
MFIQKYSTHRLAPPLLELHFPLCLPSHVLEKVDGVKKHTQPKRVAYLRPIVQMSFKWAF